jgi:hypothetical protein
MWTVGMKRFWLSLLILFACGGLYFWFLTAQYIFNYISESGNEYRGEYIQGAFLSFAMAAPIWFVVSGISLPIRKSISRKALIVINLPSIISLLALAALTLVPLLIHIVGVGNAT